MKELCRDDEVRVRIDVELYLKQIAVEVVAGTKSEKHFFLVIGGEYSGESQRDCIVFVIAGNVGLDVAHLITEYQTVFVVLKYGESPFF